MLFGRLQSSGVGRWLSLQIWLEGQKSGGKGAFVWVVFGREHKGREFFSSCRGFHCQGGEESFLRGIGRVETELFLLEDPRYAPCFLSSLIIHCFFPQFVIVLLVLCRLRWTARAICLLVET